jgi:protoheme IX farnesyltransferase
VIKRFRTILVLGKIWIVLLSTSSTAAGFMLAAGFKPGALLLTLAGVFLLACGSAAINQVQDRTVDARMERTNRRPLPAGSITPGPALLLGAAGVLAGLALLCFTSSATAALLGLAAVLWYNGVYAWLKRRTPFAAVPGGVVGALPPLIGWTAGGGSPFDRTILSVAFCLFIWQVPHFWLLLLRHEKDFGKSGLPVLTKLFSQGQLSRVTFVWIVSTVVACCMLPLYVPVQSLPAIAGLGIAGALLLWRAKEILVPGRAAAASGAVFRMINVYVLLVLSLLAFQVVA